jgi:hypothetical protein
MVVVFKKDIPLEIAKKVMDDQKRPYRTGMDSSRGKQYFYSTGPKFLVKVKSDEIQEFTEHFQSLSEVYEVYEADWKIIKD